MTILNNLVFISFLMLLKIHECFSAPASHDTEQGGIKVNNYTLHNCMISIHLMRNTEMI